MTAITRQSAKIFAQNAPVGQVTAFRTTESTPQTTKAPDQIQNENYLQGWLNADGSGNVLPYAEDMNGLFYTLSYNTAYLYEKGIPEYSSTQTYYLNSFCQYSGTIYRCKGDSVINIAPTNTNYWDALPSSSYTATTVGAATSNYGTVYAGTNTAGTQFQFKTIIGGSNVTITEANDSLTISSTGGGGGTAITASAPLDLTNNVLSIPAATSSQGGYLTAADWTSFNSKLSSTIFSSSNTWTASNNFSNILPRTNNTYTLGSESYAWTEVYTNYLLSNSNDHLVIGKTTDLNRVLVNYITNGGEWGIFPDTISGTESYLGNSTYSWDFAYIGTLNAADAKLTSSVITGKASDTTAYKKIKLSGYTGNTESTLTDWANLGWISGTTFGFRPYVSDTGYIGSYDYYWNKGFFTELHTSSIYSSYDALNSISKIDLYYNTNVIESAPVQWGTMGYVSSNDIGIFPNVDNTYKIGATGARFKEIWARVVQHSNKVHTYSQGNNFAVEWYNNSASESRTVLFDTNDVYPYQNNTINLGKTNNRWNTIYYNTLNPPSDSKLKDDIEDLSSGLKIINDLEIKSYTFKSNKDHIEYGIIAQDVVEKYPELVSIPESEDGYYGIYLHNFVFASIKAIQELSAKVDDLQQQLMELKK